MAWVQKPPETAVSGEFFNVTYAVFASDGFYQYAVQNGILSHRYYLLSCFHCHEYMVILYVHAFFVTQSEHVILCSLLISCISLVLS